MAADGPGPGIVLVQVPLVAGKGPVVLPQGEPAVSLGVDEEPDTGPSSPGRNPSQVPFVARGDVELVEMACVAFYVRRPPGHDEDVELLVDPVHVDGRVDAVILAHNTEIPESARHQLVADHVGAGVAVNRLLPVVRQVGGEIQPSVALHDRTVDLSLRRGPGPVFAADHGHVLRQRGQFPRRRLVLEEAGAVQRRMRRGAEITGAVRSGGHSLPLAVEVLHDLVQREGVYSAVHNTSMLSLMQRPVNLTARIIEIIGPTLAITQLMRNARSPSRRGRNSAYLGVNHPVDRSTLVDGEQTESRYRRGLPRAVQPDASVRHGDLGIFSWE